MCKVGQGVQGTRRAVVTAGERSGSVTEAWSTDGAGLSKVQNVNIAKIGIVSMTVHGNSLWSLTWYTGNVREDQTACEGTEWVSETSIMCRMAQSHSAVGTMRVIATLGENLKSVSQAFSFDPAFMTSIESINYCTICSVLMTVLGNGLEIFEHTQMASLRAGHSACEATAWVSDTSVIASRIASLTGGSKHVLVTVGLQAGSMTEAWSADDVRLSAIERNTTGSAWMTVRGNSIGIFEHTQRGRAGHSACEASTWVSDTSILASLASRAGGSKHVLVTGGHQAGSMTEAWSADDVGLILKNGNMPTWKGVLVTMPCSFSKCSGHGSCQFSLPPTTSTTTPVATTPIPTTSTTPMPVTTTPPPTPTCPQYTPWQSQTCCPRNSTWNASVDRCVCDPGLLTDYTLIATNAIGTVQCAAMFITGPYNCSQFPSYCNTYCRRTCGMKNNGCGVNSLSCILPPVPTTTTPFWTTPVPTNSTNLSKNASNATTSNATTLMFVETTAFYRTSTTPLPTTSS